MAARPGRATRAATPARPALRRAPVRRGRGYVFYFHGAGFINRTSDLYQYCKVTGIEGFVYGDRFCVLRR